MFYSSLKFVNSSRSNWIWHIGINCYLVLDCDILADEGSKTYFLSSFNWLRVVCQKLFRQKDFFYFSFYVISMIFSLSDCHLSTVRLLGQMKQKKFSQSFLCRNLLVLIIFFICHVFEITPTNIWGILILVQPLSDPQVRLGEARLC